MRVLIIGGTGLMSTAICAQLLARGDEVTVYNRGQRESRVPGQVRHIRGDRTQHGTFERQMAEAGAFDCVIDMICYRPQEAESDIRAFAGRTGHLVFCSTVDVYAKPAGRYPYRENEPRRPQIRAHRRQHHLPRLRQDHRLLEQTGARPGPGSPDP